MGAVGAGTRIEVEPDALIGAGKQLGSLGTQLGMLSDALGSVVSGGIASGTDPAGLDFGLKYGDQAQEFATGLADAANAFKSVGFMLEATGHNYKNADAASTVGGSGPTGGVGSPPSETKAGDAATGPNSNTVSPPSKWHLIVPFLNALPGGMFAGAALTWPSGNSGMMRLTAAQWRNLGQGLSIFDDAVAPVKALVSAQQIPEGGKIVEVLGKLGEAVSNMSASASGLAQAIDDFAGGVQETQDAIRRLLDRISLDGAWDMVKGIFTGEADDILREVARDVGTVLENFQRQVKGVVGLLEQLASALGDAVTSLQNWVRPHLEELLGDEVGGALADAFTLYTDFQVGLTTGLINTVAGTVAMADPDTWKGIAETVVTVAKDPSKLPGVLADMGKEFVAWDKWSGDHPGRAAGEAAFNIGSLFVPGGALSKTGSVAKGLGAARGLLDSGRIPGLRGLGSGNGTPGVDGVPDLESVGAGLPDAPSRPPAIPESILNPTSPNGVDAPSSPRGLEGPAGPPNPPGPAATPGGGDSPGARGGGDGPPPGPPGTPTGPTDSGPSRADGPPPQSPSAPGPGDSPTSPSTPSPSEPSAPNHAPDAAGDQAPPAAQHSPDASSPAGSRDVPSDATHPPSTHETRAPETNQTPDATTHSGGGVSASPGGHAGDGPGQGSSNTVESNGHSDARPPAQSPAAHSPAAENHGTGERTTDTTSPAQQQHASTDGNTARQESGSGVAPPAGMAGMAPHAPGATHSPSAAHSPETRTPETRTPEARTPDARTPDARTPEARTPDARAPHAAPQESPRAHQPAATGPVPGHTPTAPVNPAAGAAHTSGASDRLTSADAVSRGSQPLTNGPSPVDSGVDGSGHERPAPGDSQPRTTQSAGNGLQGGTPDGPSDPLRPDAPNNPPHTGLHDPPASHGIAGDRLPDLTDVNAEYRLANGSVDPDRFDEWTRAVADEYPRISQDGVAGVYDYTTQNYQGMNPYLRNVDPLSPQQQSILGADSIDEMTDAQRSSWEERISDTDDGLASLPPYRADPSDSMSSTWRGMHASDELLAQLNVGDTFSDAAYLSTSLDSRVAQDFALSADPDKTPTLLEVRGHNGVDVSQLSRYTEEAEVLFPRGSQFEVISRTVGEDGMVRIVLKQMQS